MEALTENSTDVLVGQAGESKAQLNPDGDVLTIEYEIRIIEPIKGNFRQGNSIEVAMLGGFIEFEDHTSVEVQTPGSRTSDHDSAGHWFNRNCRRGATTASEEVSLKRTSCKTFILSVRRF